MYSQCIDFTQPDIHSMSSFCALQNEESDHTDLVQPEFKLYLKICKLFLFNVIFKRYCIDGHVVFKQVQCVTDCT